MLLLTAAAIGAAAAAFVAPVEAAGAVARTWPPFVLVTGLLLIGVVANQDGLFATTAELLGRLPGGEWPLYVAAMLLVATVTVFLNLDTSVAFLTPVLVLLARRRGANELRYLYGCVYMSNAASLLLPGSNLTNLLILSGEPISGLTFLSRMLAPWMAAVLVTAVIVAIAFRGGRGVPVAQQRSVAAGATLSIVAVLIAIALILGLSDSALAVLAVGFVLVAIRLVQRRLSIARVGEGVDILSLVGVFLLAVALGTVATVWAYPGQLMTSAGTLPTAVIGAVAAVLINNLPAAVLLGSHMPAHARSLLFGLNIGPNLAVTGSLSALLWWQAAKSVGARPSARRYSSVGIVLVPITIAAALAAGRFTVI